jgi:TolA-binding protein
LALVLLLGCAGGGAASRDLDALRAEVRALRQENDALARKVEALSARVEVASVRLARGGAAPAPARADAGEPPATAPVVPPDLAVVKVAPAAHARRAAPPVATAIPIAEPDLSRLGSLGSSGGRALADAAEADLRAARNRTGLERAHALEDFAARYPRHPSADNALVEASEAYAASGKDDAACALARRVDDDYPAGDARSDAAERLAWCASRRGDAVAERRILERVVNEFPRTPAAERAAARLARSN